MQSKEKIEILKIYLQECTKYEHHYSVTRSALTTFLIFISVSFGAVAATRLCVFEARLAGYAMIVGLLMLSGFLSFYFQKLSAASVFAQRSIGKAINAYSKGEGGKNATDEVDKVLSFYSPAEIIDAHTAGKVRKPHWPSGVPEDDKSIAGLNPSDTPNKIALTTYVWISICFFLILFEFHDEMACRTPQSLL